MSEQIVLGSVVRDVTTDLCGTAVAVVKYLSGVVEYQIQPKVLTDGKPAPAVWVNETYLADVPGLNVLELPRGAKR